MRSVNGFCCAIAHFDARDVGFSAHATAKNLTPITCAEAAEVNGPKSVVETNAMQNFASASAHGRD